MTVVSGRMSTLFYIEVKMDIILGYIEYRTL